jgi:small subunit ribosomal protein S2
MQGDSQMAAGVTMRQMLEAGVHFGHQTRRWNPNMRQFIFAERNGIHILDLAQTVQRLDTALQRVRETVSSGDKVLFVGTKKQARAIVQAEAERCGMPFVNTRWLGGTLTNFQTLSKRIQYFKELEERFATGEVTDAAEVEAEGVEAGESAEGEASEGPSMTKREQMRLQKEFGRLRRSFGGLRTMERLPGLVFIIDPAMEDIAVHEANRAKVPVIAMCDTNANPDVIDYPVPSNDDAIRAIQLMTGRIADAVLEGVAVGEVEQQFQQVATPAPAVPAAPRRALPDAPAAPAAPAPAAPAAETAPAAAAPATPEAEAVASAEAVEPPPADAPAEATEAPAAETPSPETPAADAPSAETTETPPAE